MWKPVQPEPEPVCEPEPTPEPAPEPEPVEPAITDGQKAIMDVIIDIETKEVSFRKNLIYATIFGGVFGIFAGLIACIPFTTWVHAAYLPSAMAKPFLIWSALSGCAAGAIAGFSQYGVVGGAVVFAGLSLLMQLIAAVSTIFAGRVNLGYHQFVGFWVAYAAQSAALLTLRLMGRKIVLPSKASNSPLRRMPGMMPALTAAMAVLCLISLFRYSSASRAAQNDPARAVAGYYWAMQVSNKDISAMSPWITEGLAVRATADPATVQSLKLGTSTLPTARALKAISIGKGKDNVQMLGTMAARVQLTTNSDGSWVPAPWKDTFDTSTLSQITFDLSQEDGRWKISAVPAVTYPGND